MKKYTIGYFRRSKKQFYMEIPRNTDDLIQNEMIIDQMGGGKSNALMSITYGLHSTYHDSKGKYGALPIVFVPKFEWYKISLDSLDDNIAPDLSPKGLDAQHVTFPCCGKPDHIDIPLYSIDFSELTVEDIGTFANMKSLKDLGEIRALIRGLPKGYNIKDFLQALQNEEGGLKSKYAALYYIFATLEEEGLFDVENYPKFEWIELIAHRKPIVISFGNVENHMFQALGGYLLRKIYDLGDYKYNHCVLKKNKIQEAKQQNRPTDLKLDVDEKFLLDYFNFALLVDEAPRMFQATTSSNLASFPATKYFQVLSSNDGRKMGLKYSFLVTQYYKDVYFKFRKRIRYAWFGSRVSKEDRDFISDNKILHPDDVPAILKNPKYFFTRVDMLKYQNNYDSIVRATAISKFKTYRSPSGVF